MASLAEALPAEINRVRALQKRYEALRGQPGVNPEPAIAMMEQAITGAINAQSGHVIDMLAAFERLKGFTE